ncbi:glycosyltransferase [Candidatus Saccharibacteria bacterium]|nr:glycosyltransferase [Candidatus Saccharibacteria bacterium]MCL1962830.1 glycosyltransferase [Candidatus Saccharibacteria bacterium]
MKKNSSSPVRVALVVPHIFINRDILSHVIFSPGRLALDLAAGLGDFGVDVTLCTPGAAEASVQNLTADMSYFDKELARRGYGYLELLKKHPAVFVALARQVQAELIADVYARANADKFDIVHVYTNEEDIALQFARLCQKPVLFTHHDPFNFLIKYKSLMPKYKNLNWLSISTNQRRGMPDGTNWVANIYHGIDMEKYTPRYDGSSDYFAYIGRIIEPKGVHLAIDAVNLYNEQNPDAPMKLKLAGKHYSGVSKDEYWTKVIEPRLGGAIEYAGHLKGEDLGKFLREAKALIVPSIFAEPFGMVTLEAMASGTPVIGSRAGATPEIIIDGQNGFLVDTPAEIATAMSRVNEIDRRACRRHVEQNFSLEKMVREHAEVYQKTCGG